MFYRFKIRSYDACSARIYRLELNVVLKYLLIGLVSVLAVVVYFVGAILVSMLLRSSPL